MATTNPAGETYEEVRRRKLEENRRKVNKFNQEAAASNPSPCFFSIVTTNSLGESYADARRRKLEKNRKRLEEINRRRLSAAEVVTTNSLGESYAEARKRKLEVNRKRLKEIILRRRLSAATAGSATPKPSPVKKSWGKLASEDRPFERRCSPRFLERRGSPRFLEQTRKEVYIVNAKNYRPS